MNNCPGADALTTIAGALDWNTQAGIEHMRSCTECRARIRLLEGTHTLYTETEPLSDVVLQQVMHTVREARAAEQRHGRVSSIVVNLIEALLAGATALTVVEASGAPSSSLLNAALCGLVGLGVLAYRMTSVEPQHATDPAV